MAGARSDVTESCGNWAAFVCESYKKGKAGQPPLSWNRMRTRNILVHGCEACAIRAREAAQVAIGNLPGRSDPAGKMGNIVFVEDELETSGRRLLKSEQQGTSSGNGESVGWGLGRDTHESEFG